MGADEVGRAVNGILDATGSGAPRCPIWKLREPAVIAPFRMWDRLRWRLGRRPAKSPVRVTPAGELEPTGPVARAAHSSTPLSLTDDRPRMPRRLPHDLSPWQFVKASIRTPLHHNRFTLIAVIMSSRLLRIHQMNQGRSPRSALAVWLTGGEYGW